MNNRDIFTDNLDDRDILYINTKKNQEIIAKMSFYFNESKLNLIGSFNNIELIGSLKTNGDDIYEFHDFKGYHKLLNINNKYEDKAWGVNYKSIKFDIIGRLEASQISEDLWATLGAPNINNINKIKARQWIIYLNKNYDNYLFDFQLINEHYDSYFQSSTPPFNPIIPIINFERMNLKRRIALNIGITRNHILGDFLIKLFFKQQIPIKQYYYTDNNQFDIYSNSNQYGGSEIGFNLYFN